MDKGKGQYILRIRLKNGVVHKYEMLDEQSLDSALSAWLDEYPTPLTIALELKPKDGQACFADIRTEDIFAMECERPITEGMRVYQINNLSE